MRILILGASGYLGSSIWRDLAKRNVVDGTYSSRERSGLQRLNVVNCKEVLRFIGDKKPEVIVNCAGISSLFKVDPSLGRLVNIEGTRNVILGAKLVGASLVHISSTAVFDGQEGPFAEEDEPKSSSEFGITKIEGEKILQSSNVKYCIIRPSLVLGNSPYGMERKDYGKILVAIATGQAMELDDNWKFAPSWNRHVSNVINWWMVNQDRVNLLHVVASETITKLQFAKMLCKKLGITPTMFVKKKNVIQSTNNILSSCRLGQLGAPTTTLNEMITGMVLEIRK